MRILAAGLSGLTLCLGAWLPAKAAPPVLGRTCVNHITFGRPLCDPGRFNAVAAPFSLYAKTRKIYVDVAGRPAGMADAFNAYAFSFSGASGAGWIAPPAMAVAKPLRRTEGSLGALRLRLYNRLPRVLNETIQINHAIGAGEQPINLHTHGLVVLPHTADANGAYGDYVGVLACPADTAPACPPANAPASMTNACAAARSAQLGHPCQASSAPPAHDHHHEAHADGHDVRFGFVKYAIDIPAWHPSSLAWFHPHAHSLSSAHIGAGLSGVLTIGGPCSDPSLDAASRSRYCRGSRLDPRRVTVRMMMLKDFQVFEKRQGTAPSGWVPRPGEPAANEASAEGYRILPTCDDASFDANHLLQNSYCAFPKDAASENAGHWLFTINGQVRPTIAMREGRPELWRLANVSSNASYRLSLCRSAAVPDTQSDAALVKCDDAKQFQIVSLDGGTKLVSGALGGETEVLLPPGARAEIWIVPAKGETLTLTQKGFKRFDLTAGNPNGDYYPPATLASVTTQAAPRPVKEPAVALNFGAAPADRARQPVAFEKPEDCENKPAALGPRDWLSLTGNSTVSLMFGKAPPQAGSDAEVLTVGMIAGDPMDGPDKAAFQTCLDTGDANSAACDGFKGAPFVMDHRNLCLRHGAKITFRIYNLTTESHNFHIHQQKFAVTAPTLAATREVSAASALGSVNQRSLASAAAGAGAAQGSTFIVDSVPLPSYWSKEKNSRTPVEVTMNFDKPTQVGDFVFHCHILEHEDKGMMKRITVWTQDRR